MKRFTAILSSLVLLEEGFFVKDDTRDVRLQVSCCITQQRAISTAIVLVILNIDVLEPLSNGSL